MMNVASQSTRGRSRSRSRSASVKRIRRYSVPRGISRYLGNCKLTRTCNYIVSANAAAGFSIGATTYSEAILTVSPLGFTMWGSNVNYTPISFPNNTEFSALWEKVKIEKVEWTITSNTTDNAATGTLPSNSSIKIYLGNDFDGPTSGATSGTDLVMQCTDCKMYSIGGDLPPVVWTLKPKFKRLVQYTSLTSSSESATGYVASDTDIPHYGTRIGILNNGNIGAARVYISAKVFMSFKNVK